MRLDVDVGYDRDLRRRYRRVLQTGGESLRGGRHEIRVKRTRHRELHDHPRLELRFGDLCHLVDGGDGAGDGIVAVAEVVCDLHGFAAAVRARLGADLVHLIRREANHGCHPGRRSVRGGLHGLTAELDELDAVLECDGARERERGVFAERESGADVDGVDQSLALVGGFHLLESGEGGDVDGRLRHLGGVELLRRAVDAHVEEIVAENLGRLVEERLRLGALVAELLGHADGLRALPWGRKGVLESSPPRRRSRLGARRARGRRT